MEDVAVETNVGWTWCDVGIEGAQPVASPDFTAGRVPSRRLFTLNQPALQEPTGARQVTRCGEPLSESQIGNLTSESAAREPIFYPAFQTIRP